jgi:hypothetical protein
MHLSPEELIDLVEGARAEADAPHLQSCEVCRHQVAALRTTMSAVADADLPEPSPLFWDHLSQRVREAVAAEEGRPSRFGGWRWGRALPGALGALSGASSGASSGSWRAWAAAGVAASVVIAIYVTAPPTSMHPSGARDGAAAAAAPLEPFGAADDPSLALFADLTEQMDPLSITDAGWSSRVGAVDEVVASLTAAECLELQRLLKEELAKS